MYVQISMKKPPKYAVFIKIWDKSQLQKCQPLLLIDGLHLVNIK
jgi:hypothetical protein